MVGITCTGAHGSGITVPPLAAMIRGVTLVSANFGHDGKPIVYRIEPTKGMTDPEKHRSTSILIQDDDNFNAITVGLGAFGIVYSITIETVPFYWIREYREFVDWSVAKKQLQQGSNGDILRFHNAEVWLNAYTSHTLITKREKVTHIPKPKPKPSLMKRILLGIYRILRLVPCARCFIPNPADPFETLTSNPSTHVFDALLDSVPALRRIWRSIERRGGLLDDKYKEIGTSLGLLLRHLPLLVPAVSDSLVQEKVTNFCTETCFCSLSTFL